MTSVFQHTEVIPVVLWMFSRSFPELRRHRYCHL